MQNKDTDKEPAVAIFTLSYDDDPGGQASASVEEEMMD